MPLLILALCGSCYLARGASEPAEPHHSMQPATNSTITRTQRGFSPVASHEKPTGPASGSKIIDSQDRTLCQDCLGAVLLVGLVCAVAIASLGGMGFMLLPTPDHSGAALHPLLHPLSAIIVALIPHGSALRQACGAESTLLLSGGAALAVLCAAWPFFPVRTPSVSALSSLCWLACAASAAASAS